MHHSISRGMGLIEVIIGIAVMLVVFTALLGLLRVSLSLSTLAKAKAGARELASSKMEYLRGLSYNALPSGTQATTTVLNGMSYSLRTTINYYDDPADGTNSGDTNGIIHDYKQATVTVTYPQGTATDSIELMSNFAPDGIETNTP